MNAIQEDRAAIDALPLYEWGRARVGLLATMSTDVVVIPRAEYVKLAERAIDDALKALPDNVRADLLHTAATADRFALGTWCHEMRGCGCLVGEYLIAAAEIDEPNTALKERAALAAGTSIEQRLQRNRGDEVGDTLQEIGQDMDELVRDHIYAQTRQRMLEATVFIRDEPAA
jgi:hypothetical protein